MCVATIVRRTSQEGNLPYQLIIQCEVGGIFDQRLKRQAETWRHRDAGTVASSSRLAKQRIDIMCLSRWNTMQTFHLKARPVSFPICHR